LGKTEMSYGTGSRKTGLPSKWPGKRSTTLSRKPTTTGLGWIETFRKRLPLRGGEGGYNFVRTGWRWSARASTICSSYKWKMSGD